MRALFRAKDWAATPLGPVERWPLGLRTLVQVVLAAPTPMILLWGPELVQLYNDGYRQIMGVKHPAGLGMRNRDCWGEVWDFTGPIYEGVMERGESFHFVDQRLVLERGSGPEETYWTLGYSPAPDDEGGVGGVLVTVLHTTASVHASSRREAERTRMRAELREGDARLQLALDVAEIGTWTLDLATNVCEVDRRGAEIVGVSPGVVPDIERAWRERTHPDDLERLLREVRSGVERGESFDIDYRVVLPGGRVRHVVSRARAIRDASGRPVRLVGTSRDVTAEHVAAAQLRASEAKYRALFTTMDEGFCILQMIFDDAGRPVDYRFDEVNPAFERHTGLRDAIGRTARELVPDIESHWFEWYGRVATTGEPARFESGSASMGRWFEVDAWRIGDPAERRVALLFNDVTQRRLATAEQERLLRAVERERARLVEVFRQAPAFMTVLRGPDLVLELVNDAYQQLIGHREVVGRPLFDAVPEARGQGFEELMARVLATGEPFLGRELPVRLQRQPGAPLEERLLDIAYVALVEDDGTRSGIVVCGTDVTDQVRARREVERARDRAERLQRLTAALAPARTLDDVADVVVADMVVALGARTGALAGRAPEGDALLVLRTIGFPESVGPTVRRQPLDMASPLVECYRSREPLFVESREGPDGLDARYPPIAPVWDVLGVASAAFVPLLVAGEVIGVISFGFAQPRVFEADEREFLGALGRQAALAVERARLFDAERAARAEAERANRAKGEFLAVMSHELRTPLNAIGGYAELLELGLRGPVTEQQRADLARIQQSQRHLLGLINQVLNYTRVDGGAVRYDVVEVPVAEALAAAEALVVPQVRARGLTYVLAAVPPHSGGAPLAVRADREKLQQVLLNLLSNAIKFTEPGGEVRVGSARAGEQVQISVSDNGIGISADKLAHIFEPFVQVDQRLTRPHEGVGLGLAISRDLARGMGGDITATSTPGHGSTFVLSLPAA